MLRRFKMLPLPEWLINARDSEFRKWLGDDPNEWQRCCSGKDDSLPKFGRNGYYYDRLTKKTWFELDGESWLYREPKDFLWDLEHSDGNPRMSDEDYRALTLLFWHGVLKRKADHRLFHQMHVERERRDFARFCRDNGLSAIRARSTWTSSWPNAAR